MESPILGTPGRAWERGQGEHRKFRRHRLGAQAHRAMVLKAGSPGQQHPQHIVRKAILGPTHPDLQSQKLAGWACHSVP